MILSVNPTEKLAGHLKLPSSKSYSIRAFLIAACGGDSVIKNASHCDDALAAKRIAQGLGARITKLNENSYRIRAQIKYRNKTVFNVGESGTVLRFLLPLLSFYTKMAKVIGHGTLVGRPNVDLTKTLRSMGMKILGRGPRESVPIIFHGGQLQAGEIFIKGETSSQFISGLLIACPLLSWTSKVVIRGRQVVSRDYIIMTKKVLKEAGIKIIERSDRIFEIPGKQSYRGLHDFIIPADYGLAAFILAAASLIKSELILKGPFHDEFLQADGRILGFLRRMGVSILKDHRTIKIKGPFLLKGGSFSLKDSPDLVPIMTVLALFAKGRTRLYDIRHVRIKESDRIRDLRTELIKIGAQILEKPNEMIIIPQMAYRHYVLLDPHHDHRLAMSFSVLGLKLGVSVKDIECTHKSYPGFVRDFISIGSRITKRA